MYEIKPQSLKTFIEDTSIKLPRFQRKKTWNSEKNFLLSVSVFKGYPLGVSILNIEKGADKKQTKWLLDGRQRRTALTEMYNNPEQIYLWAKKYVKFNSNNSENEVILKFIEKVNEYIELDTVNNEVIEENDNIELDAEDNDTIEENDKNISDVDNIEPINSDNIILRNSGLQLLAR